MSNELTNITIGENFINVLKLSSEMADLFEKTQINTIKISADKVLEVEDCDGSILRYKIF